MIQDPPATGSAELNSFLVDVKNAINTAAKPLAGWKLSDFEAGVSEVISDKRDLIDIVTAWDDLVNIRNNFETEVARYETLYSDSKVLGNQYQEYADTFSQIMEWWDQNVRLIEDIEAFMIKVEADTSTAVSSASAAATSETKAKTSETNAKTSETKAKTSETNAKTSETKAKTSETNAKTSETNADESENVALDASAAAIVAAINVAQYNGTGSPEGVVAAPVGSIYTDTAATAGAIRWIKTSGTGNTGWRVEWGDTGWRDIRSSLVRTESISAGGTAQINRANSRVTLTMYDLSIIGSGTVRITDTLPVGFRPTYRDGFNISLSSETAREGVVMSTGLYLYSVPSSSNMRLRTTLSWATSDPWPTTLPGIPA